MNEKIRVLVVDDNDINSFLLTHIIEAKFEATIDNATDGIEAIDFAAKNKYDIIFMDIEMPRMHGIEATEIIRGEKLNGDTMIVFVSAYLMEHIQINYPQFDSKELMCNKPVNARCIHDFIIKATT
jgi:CheY-like chemotaxis protein